MTLTKKKKLPVGIENFEKIITEDFYYVDKTVMIKDLLNKWGEVNLFTRPRRFGKSLNMSMLKAFFEIGCNKSLFDGLKISKDKPLCDKYMGKFPVISISLKDIDGSDYPSARSIFCSVIVNEALRFYDLFENSSQLNAAEQQQYKQLINIDANSSDGFIMPEPVLKSSLKVLSALLEKHYGQKVIILIDEYDVPLAKANEHGYYDDMVLLLRGVLQQALKTNSSLYFSVMTGCLPAVAPSPLGSKIPRQVDEVGFPAKLDNTSLSSQCQSIFTGLNNPKILSITAVRFDEYFGFTDSEVQAMLKYYGLSDKHPLMQEWYNGYRFGNTNVYCPWDVISYCDDLTDNPQVEPKNYWSNTSSNDIVRHFISRMDSLQAKNEMEALIAGETVTKDIHEELTYNSLYDSIENMWSVLFMTGYLTYRTEPMGKSYCLAIPNMEIRNIFTEQIMAMFKKDIAQDGQHLRSFCEALKNGEPEKVEKQFTNYLQRTISIRDTFARKPIKENFYHGILLGILGYKSDWYVRSNKESGNGYSDISIEIGNEGIGIIIEVKYSPKADMDNVCEDAIKQIENTGYTEQLKNNDCHTILKYGIACYKKQCRVMLKTEK